MVTIDENFNNIISLCKSKLHKINQKYTAETPSVKKEKDEIIIRFLNSLGLQDIVDLWKPGCQNPFNSNTTKRDLTKIIDMMCVKPKDFQYYTEEDLKEMGETD